MRYAKVAFEDVTVGDELPRLVKGPIEQIQLTRYAGASGDFNPIHQAEAVAWPAGMGRVFAVSTREPSDEVHVMRPPSASSPTVTRSFRGSVRCTRPPLTSTSYTLPLRVKDDDRYMARSFGPSAGTSAKRTMASSMRPYHSPVKRPSPLGSAAGSVTIAGLSDGAGSKSSRTTSQGSPAG